MPRRQFIADLGQAIAGVSTSSISNVEQDEDDGQFRFTCTIPDGQIRLTALIPEVSEYPSSHTCMLFAADDAPTHIALLLDAIARGTSGKTVQQILDHVAHGLQSRDKDGNVEMTDSQDYEEVEDDSDEADDFFPGDDPISQPFNGFSQPAQGSSSAKSTLAFRQRVRSDLLTARLNGFKVGCLGGLMDGLACYVSLSCRISKLGISEEAMQAWDVKPTEYLVLVISYPNGYKSLEALSTIDLSRVPNNFAMRIGISNTYKPTLQEAIRAFTDLSKEKEQHAKKDNSDETQGTMSSPPRGFRDSFVSRPLNGLFKDRFAQLLRYRYNGMSWHGAETFYLDTLGHKHHSELALADKYMASDSADTKFPALVTSDHISEAPVGQEHSLPLISMQFALRHFVRCTEFCLVCFSKMPDDLQAIKPYVCDNSLCLWQYMSLGFGPSIEHEILSQPKVVDLLISFCYTSARTCKLADFPNGLSLMVPLYVAYKGLPDTRSAPLNPSGQSSSTPGPTTVEGPVKMRYNAATKEILFEDRNIPCPVHTGEWLVIRTDDDPTQALHCRVINTSLYPTVSVSEPITAAPHQDSRSNASPFPWQPQPSLSAPPQAPWKLPQPPSNEFRKASFYAYNRNFDELQDHEKRDVIVALLDLLPSVAEMSQYLQHQAQSTLRSWVNRLSPAGLGILRWIIASNRACIMQVADNHNAGPTSKDRIYGVSGWTQFRFAMGAPDKERRFLDAVRQTTQRLHLTYPTLFAWHGSPLQNWHSIIREGLHFKETAHGRAYGHGVYHSLDCNTSLSYSSFGRAMGSEDYWPKSELAVRQAMALNEIVNAPKEFTSNTPHLVVAQLDWIQTRYLFVFSGQQDNSQSNKGEIKPLDFVAQDPHYTPMGPGGKLVIPKSAIGGSRHSKSHSSATSFGNKRQKTSGSTAFDPIEIDDDDDVSVVTLEQDRDILRDEDEDADASQPVVDSVGIMTPTSDKGKATIKTGFFKLFKGKSAASPATPPKPLTDYIPGTLDYKTLPMLEQPIWATPAATKRLMGDLADLLKLQSKHPLHELGWHIDGDKINNMYQWIVEMHSFDPELPLAQDMKQMGHKSIVLELRFGKEYPFAPPFVRVIRPRFLGFQQGGGGHVTAGGAMCMELLTNTGWSSILTIESILLSVRLEMSSKDPRPARLVKGNQDYGVGEAVDAYIRACNMHGWKIPPGFQEMAYGGQAASSYTQY